MNKFIKFLGEIDTYVFLNIQTWNPKSIVHITDQWFIGDIRIGIGLRTDLSKCRIENNKIYDVDLNYIHFQRIIEWILYNNYE
jgi:hypothetical protein